MANKLGYYLVTPFLVCLLTSPRQDRTCTAKWTTERKMEKRSIIKLAFLTEKICTQPWRGSTLSKASRSKLRIQKWQILMYWWFCCLQYYLYIFWPIEWFCSVLILVNISSIVAGTKSRALLYSVLILVKYFQFCRRDKK